MLFIYRDVFYTFMIAFFAVLVLTPLMRRIALKAAILDMPGGRKIHTKPIPSLGGVAIYLASMVAVYTVFRLNPLFRVEFTEHLTGFFMGGAIIIAIGLFDDIKGIGAPVKFIGQILAALVLFKYGFRVEFITNPFSGIVQLNLPISLLFTLFWIVGLTNAINLIDGLDGLAAGLSVIAGVALLAMGLFRPDVITAFLAVAIIGSTLGFLRYNFHPAKIFMGDTGSMFLGFMLGAIGMVGIGKGLTAATLMIPIVVLGIPIYDTLIAIIRRMTKKTPIFLGDRRHFHHRLLDLGLPHRQAVLWFYFVSIYLGIIGFLFTLIPTRYAFLLLIMLFMAAFTGVRMLTFIEKRLHLKK